MFASAKGSYWWYSGGLILIQGRVLVLVRIVIQCCHASHWKGTVAVLFGIRDMGRKGKVRSVETSPSSNDPLKHLAHRDIL